MPPFITQTDLAKQVTSEAGEQCLTKDVRDALYGRPDLASRCLVAGNRRLVPAEMVGELKTLILAKLRRRKARAS
ncbi:MAG TPA: hypothetical protein VEL76_00720 [Gemmataceae bacterium]|nr:hypothetical protein [Gemmataceae bacterium]